jgi:hypothetical protein
LILIAIPILLMAGMCERQVGQITCPSSHDHPPEFWAQVAIEAERIMDDSPAIMTLLSVAPELGAHEEGRRLFRFC